MTESSGPVSFTKTVEENRHYGTTGLLSANVTAKVVDTASGKAMPPNHKGELWLRGSTIMNGTSRYRFIFSFQEYLTNLGALILVTFSILFSFLRVILLVSGLYFLNTMNKILRIY